MESWQQLGNLTIQEANIHSLICVSGLRSSHSEGPPVYKEAFMPGEPYSKDLITIGLEVFLVWSDLIVNPFTPKSHHFLISPYSLTLNTTSHSLKNLAFHELLRCKMIILPTLATLLIHFLLKVGRMYFLNLGVQGLTLPFSTSKSEFSQRYKRKCIGEVVRTGKYNHLSVIWVSYGKSSSSYCIM